MEYIDDSTYLRPDLIIISPLCWFFSLKAYIELDSDPALSGADKGVEASRASLDANSKVILAGALPTNLRFYRSRDRNDSAYAISAEAVTLFRSASVDRLVFSFWSMPFPSVLTDSRRRIARTSHSTIFESVELWPNLQSFAPVATKRQRAGALYELAKFSRKGADKRTLRNELQIAQSAVSTFREVSPLDYASLAYGLYLYADRMLELNKNAATYFEESVQYFPEVREGSPQTYAVGLIFSLSLASSRLACTGRCADALEYAKHAVEVQHERSSDGDAQYVKHLRQLLMGVVFRSTEIGRREDALPWMQEMHQLGLPEDSEIIKGQLL
ncbi:hypothetical protein EDB85DRAFT_450842 [Lactarius pseudohatsudake]|nr:hypothetical protein EDB85DRAFT_450842 [Lactarius pseudohatsudake]